MARRPLPRRVAPAAALLVFDVLSGVCLGWPSWAHPASVTMGGRQDTPYTVWALAWVARAVTHGQNPWVTNHLSYPAGVNLLTNATATGIGLALTPITRWFGPLVAFNVAATAALALTAWSAQLVMRRGLGVTWAAATVGGMVAGFGPTALAQTGGAHVHVIAGFLVPPLLLGVGRLASGMTAHPWRWGAAIGTMAVGQLLIGEEVLAIAALTALIGVAVVARRVHWRCLLTGAAVAAGVFAVLGAAPLWVQLAGRGHIVGPIQRGDRYADDLTAFVVPIRQVWLGSTWFGDVSRHFSSEGGAYLGLPLLVACVVVVVRRIDDLRVRALAGSALGAAVLSLGSELSVAGRSTRVPLPWAPLAHLPLVVSLLPVRFGVMLDLAAGALLAVGLDDVARRRGLDDVARRRGLDDVARRRARDDTAHVRRVAAAGAVAVVCLVPLLPRLPFRTTKWSVPAFFRGEGADAVGDGAVVVVSPYPSEADPPVEVWLAEAGDRWRSAGGTYFVPGRAGHVTIGGPVPVADAVDVRLEQGVAATALVPLRGQVVADLQDRHVRAVIAGPGPHRDQVVRWWTTLLGPSRPVGGVDLWTID